MPETYLQQCDQDNGSAIESKAGLASRSMLEPIHVAGQDERHENPMFASIDRSRRSRCPSPKLRHLSEIGAIGGRRHLDELARYGVDDQG